MNLETNITPAMRFELLKALRNYRASEPAIPCGSFESEMAWERRNSEECLDGLLGILSRGISSPVDMEVIESMDKLKQTALTAPPPRTYPA